MSLDLSVLASCDEVWKEWRFEPWQSGSASGLFRRVSFIKAGLLGEVARYYVDDYVVFSFSPDDVRRLRKGVKYESDLLTQRFFFVQESGESFCKKFSLLFGFRGFVEFHFYSLGSEPSKDVEDLAFLVNRAFDKVGSFSA
ncbi:MAG: hypothetical protein RR272_00010 [Synergistaceae bacterium]